MLLGCRPDSGLAHVTGLGQWDTSSEGWAHLVQGLPLAVLGASREAMRTSLSQLQAGGTLQGSEEPPRLMSAEIRR